KSGKSADNAVYPTSEYQQLDYALDDGNMEAAKAELSKLIKSKGSRQKVSDGFHERLRHAWTGSQKTDADFRKSLSKEDAEMLKEADERRKIIWDRYLKIGTVP